MPRDTPRRFRGSLQLGRRWRHETHSIFFGKRPVSWIPQLSLVETTVGHTAAKGSSRLCGRPTGLQRVEEAGLRLSWTSPPLMIIGYRSLKVLALWAHIRAVCPPTVNRLYESSCGEGLL